MILGELKYGFSDKIFEVKPQTLEDNLADYEAVMTTKNELRIWSDSSWPEDNFTLQENYEDLQGHINDHSEGIDFGFSIWSSNEKTFLGSLYINDPAGLDEDYPKSFEINKSAQIEVRIEYWLRSGVLPETEKAFVLAVRKWLTEKAVTRVVWGSRRSMDSRRELYEHLGMKCLVSMENVTSTRLFVLHWWPVSKI